MGLVQMAGKRMYWETDTRHAPVADVMPRNRFQSLLTSLHFVNNLTVSDTEKRDKLWKIRPWLNSFREMCLQVVPEEHNSGSPLNGQKRPSSADGSPNSIPKRPCADPPQDARKDLIGHFPMKTKRGRCRHCPKGYTNTQCRKCDVRLCFSDDKDCFWEYHCE